jgi:hypothetical protein
VDAKSNRQRNNHEIDDSSFVAIAQMIGNFTPSRSNLTKSMTKEIIMAQAKPTTITNGETGKHITNLRDLAIKLIQKNGHWRKVGGTPVIGIKSHGNLSIDYPTPFQQSKIVTLPSGYGQEVRSGRRVVPSLMWNRTGPIFLETYRPGVWEAKLEEPSVTASLAA